MCARDCRCLQKAEAVGLESQVAGSHSQCGCWEPNLGLLQENQVLNSRAISLVLKVMVSSGACGR